MANLGWMYFAGHGVKQDFAEAARWLRSGASAGDARAMGNLGTLFVLGAGVQQDYAEAARWFRRAAETPYSRIPKFAFEQLGAPMGRYSPTGDGRSMTVLGLMSLEGRGVQKDEVEGVRWLRMAMNARDRQAAFHIAVLSATGAAGIPKQTDITQLKHLFAQVESAPGDTFSGDDMTFGDGYPVEMRKLAGEYSRRLNPPTVTKWTRSDIVLGVTVLVILIAALSPDGPDSASAPMERNWLKPNCIPDNLLMSGEQTVQRVFSGGAC
jgi:hypothetical protein